MKKGDKLYYIVDEDGNPIEIFETLSEVGYYYGDGDFEGYKVAVLQVTAIKPLKFKEKKITKIEKVWSI